MNKLKNAYNIYCDESRVENKDSSKMVIGGIIIPRIKKDDLVKQIKVILDKHNYCRELKWIKTSRTYESLYKDIIDLYVSCEYLQFRAIVVNKTIINYEEYHNNDVELAFFKFYYLMLREKLCSHSRYYVYLDHKPTSDRSRAQSLLAFLRSHIYWNRTDCKIEHLQAYDSGQNVLLQIADYFTGLIGHAVNRTGESTFKNSIIQYFKQRTGLNSFDVSSGLSEQKLNLFIWQGR